MYMRFVHVRVKPDCLPDLRKLYDEKFVPILHDTPGCLYVSLIQSVEHDDECISLTLWSDRRDAERYETSGGFTTLLHDAEPYLADPTEWKIRLSKDLTLQYEAVPEEPVVNAYDVTAVESPSADQVPHDSPLYVRIVAPQIKEGKMQEFKDIYTHVILPELKNVKGCRYAYLIENGGESGHVLSVTIWESKEDAANYELSGHFTSLTDQLKHTFSEVYQWKMHLEHATHNQVITSDDMSVEGYNIVTGKSFL